MFANKATHMEKRDVNKIKIKRSKLSFSLTGDAAMACVASIDLGAPSSRLD